MIEQRRDRAVSELGGTVPRAEDRRLVSGAGSYVANVRPRAALHMAVVRSPFAHARIRAIDTSRAASARDVLAAMSATDMHPQVAMPVAQIPGLLRAPDHCPLATDRVRFVGEPVAVVVAESQHAAADAAELVEIDCEPLPAVVDAETATDSSTLVIHEELGTNVAFSLSGVRAAGLDDADVVVRQRMVNQRVIPSPMEPRGVIADYRRHDGTLVMHVSCQAPHLVRTSLATTLGIPERKVRVIAGDVGGAFGSKLNLYPEDVLVALMSMRFGRPVQWIEQRSDAMVASSHGRALTAVVEAGATRDGKITALHVDITSDIGAHTGPMAPVGAMLTAAMLPGSYRIPEVTTEIQAVYTNKTPVEPYRGYYRAEATYFVERAVDLLARELDLDPVEIRRRNLIRSDEFPFRTATGELYDSGDYEGALDRALETVDYTRLREEQRRLRSAGRYLGVGLAVYTWRAGFPSKSMGMPDGPAFLPAGWETTSVRVERTGGVTVRTGAMPHGQGLASSLTAIVCEQLGVDPGEVTVIYGDTETTPYGLGSEGSRSLVTAGSAAHLAAERVLAKATQIAAHILEAAPDDLEWSADVVSVRGVPNRSLTLYDLALIASHGTNRPPGLEPGLECAATFDPDDFNYPSGVHVSVVDVDVATGRVDVVEHVAVDDCGRRINPVIVDGQIHGGTAQGIAQALFEEAVYDPDGQPLTGSFLTYGIPSAAELPSFRTAAIETLTTRNPLGSKGAGESGTIGAPPAVVNAVVDALSPFGVTHIDMPLSPERVWRAIAAANLDTSGANGRYDATKGATP
jgi:carbon-monoxide dehydrogenase large subunit